MPSRRMLSAFLGVNPNTIQKAYKMLEDEKLIVSREGAKSIVTLSSCQLEEIRRQLLETELAAAVNALRAGGVSKKEALGIFAKMWDEIDDPEKGKLK